MLSTDLVRAIGAWSRRFEKLVVDVERAQAVPGGRRPRAVFVWGGRDAVERVQRDSEALARGEVHAVGRGGPASREVEQLLAGALPGDVDAAGARAGAAEAQPCPPLIAQAAAAQVYAVNDVLHEGRPRRPGTAPPSPRWA